MTIQDIADKALRQLNDVVERDWFDTELIPYIVLALAEIVTRNPKAYPVAVTLSLVAGAIQSIGTTYLRLLDVVCNITGYTTPGRAATFMPKEHMDSALPEWMTYTANATVRHVVRDQYDDQAFYVFPPQPSTSMGKLKVVLSQIPTITALTDTFPLDDDYAPAAVDYTVYRALMEDSQGKDNTERAKQFLSKFYNSLGLRDATAEGAK